MKPNTNYGKTYTSGKMETGSASIELTPEMFTLLSSGMYTDKILAAIREPICNARDAQTLAEPGVPLEMHLPSRLEPYFHIRDFGEGLTERQVLGYKEIQQEYNHETGELEDVEISVPGLYLRYGKSTKRDSNLQIGGLGIGCKAPLAYSDSFIVESYQGGTVKTYTVYMENGIPNVAKLNEKRTTEQDGLKVKIAVNAPDIWDFVRKAEGFMKFFDYPVEVSGAKIDTEVTYVLRNKLYDIVQCGASNFGKIKANMGGVIYNVSSKHQEYLEDIIKSNMLIMKFEIGDLAVAGSREALSEDVDTIKKLEEATVKVKEEFFAAIKTEVGDPRHSIFGAIQLLRKYGLVTRSRRDGRARLAEGATGFTIHRSPAKEVIDQYSTTMVRGVTARGPAAGTQIMLDAFTGEIPILLKMDRGSGYLKVARKLAKTLSKTVVIIGTEEYETLKGYFGEDNLTVESTTAKYLEFFPKGEATTKVKIPASGLFDSSFRKVVELEGTQEGFYVPFERETCVMVGLPNDKFHNYDKIGPVLNALMVAGQLQEGEVFYSRKAGMNTVKRTALKELTWKMVLSMAKKCFTESDYQTSLIIAAQPNSINPAVSRHKDLAPLWNKVKSSYPTWKTSETRDITKGTTFLSHCGLLPYLRPSYEVRVLELTKKFLNESQEFQEAFPMLGILRFWGTSSDQIKDVVAFCEWKYLQDKRKKAA
jgi:hypothetical protein